MRLVYRTLRVRFSAHLGGPRPSCLQSFSVHESYVCALLNICVRGRRSWASGVALLAPLPAVADCMVTVQSNDVRAVLRSHINFLVSFRVGFAGWAVHGGYGRGSLLVSESTHVSCIVCWYFVFCRVPLTLGATAGVGRQDVQPPARVRCVRCVRCVCRCCPCVLIDAEVWLLSRYLFQAHSLVRVGVLTAGAIS